MLKSLKWQVALGALVILAATIAAVGGSIYWWIEQELEQRLEDSLRLAARSTASHVTLEGNFLELYHDKLSQVESGDQFLALQVLNRRGGIIYGPKLEYSEISYMDSLESGENIFVADFEGQRSLWLDLTFQPVDEYAIEGEPPTTYRARVVVVKGLSEFDATLAPLLMSNAPENPPPVVVPVPVPIWSLPPIMSAPLKPSELLVRVRVPVSTLTRPLEVLMIDPSKVVEVLAEPTSRSPEPMSTEPEPVRAPMRSVVSLRSRVVPLARSTAVESERAFPPLVDSVPALIVVAPV